MQMSEAAEVVQVHGAQEANKKLAEGWKLLAVVPGSEPDAVSFVTYVLGKPRKSGSAGVMLPERLQS